MAKITFNKKPVKLPTVWWRMLGKWFQTNDVMPAPEVGSADALRRLSDEDKALFKRLGVTAASISQQIEDQFAISYDRQQLYREYERAREHWMVGAALELYADCATASSPLHNRSVWVTSENTVYEKELNKLLSRLGVDEKIYDWAWSTAYYGDLFGKVIAAPNLGIITIDDSMHPIDILRMDSDGQLIGFIDTRQQEKKETKTTYQLLAPWEFVHFRLLGAKVKRSLDYDPYTTEYRAVHLLSPDTRQQSSRYGTSVLLNALPVYKRLRLVEDCLTLTRMTRGVIKYIYKVKVDSTNAEAVNEVMDEYVSLLKRARAMDTSGSGNPALKDRTSIMGTVEDIILPVWGDAGDLQVEKIGGDADIKWIADVDELRNQLATALRTPQALLGGHVDEASGSLGSEALSNMDIRFSRSVRRLQRALKQGITRICQIHLAYKGMDPDPELFEVNFSESSSEEEKQLREVIDQGVDIVDKYVNMLSALGLSIDAAKVFNYLNKKILKLSDFDITEFLTDDPEKQLTPDQMDAIKDSVIHIPKAPKRSYMTDVAAATPFKASKKLWEKKFAKARVELEEKKV